MERKASSDNPGPLFGQAHKSNLLYCCTLYCG
jgi:hypothetical protein